MTNDFEIKGMSDYDIPDVLMLERKAFGKMAWSAKDFESAVNSSYDYPFVVHKKSPESPVTPVTSEANDTSAVSSKAADASDPGSCPDSPMAPAQSADISSLDRSQDGFSSVAGYSVLRVLAPEAEVEDICVSEDMRKLGIGRCLLGHMISVAAEKGAENIYLEVRSKNEAAIGLYKKMGFQDSYVRKGYYRDPVDDAVIMVLKL